MNVDRLATWYGGRFLSRFFSGIKPFRKLNCYKEIDSNSSPENTAISPNVKFNAGHRRVGRGVPNHSY